MSNEMMNYGRHAKAVDDLGKQGREIVRQVRLADLAAAGGFALARRINEYAMQTDEHRRQLAQHCGPELNAFFAETEITAMEQARTIQRETTKRIGYA